MIEAHTEGHSTCTYRTSAKPEKEKSSLERALEEIVNNPIKQRQIALYRVWLDVRLFLGVLFVFVECLLASALFVYGLTYPMVSYIGASVLAMLAFIPASFALFLGCLGLLVYLGERAIDLTGCLFQKVQHLPGTDFMLGSKQTYLKYVRYSKMWAEEKEIAERIEWEHAQMNSEVEHVDTSYP